MRNTSELKQKNKLDIIKVIRNSGPITAPEIARLSKLTAVTVHHFIDELMENNLVLEIGSSRSNGGRKATLYKLYDSYGYIIGQNLGRNYISTTIYNLNLKLLHMNKIKCLLDYSDRITTLMLKEIAIAIDFLKLDRKDCLGIGITVPGQVNHETGVIINLTNIPNWNSIPMKTIAENRLGIRTYVDNDINAIAISSKWRNIVGENADAVFINIGDGVGTGILNKGKLFYGNHSYAGEIGHTTIQYDGPKCSCGNRGCIEALTSDAAIIEKVKKNRKIDTGSKEVTIETIINLAKSGDEAVYGILMETGHIISIAVDHVVKVYDPEVIVIQSNWINEFPDLKHRIVDEVFGRCAWARRDSLSILVNRNDSIEAYGPASLVLERIFDYSEDNSFI